jgi:hypothetical protein
MRLLLFILGIFATIICIENPLRRETIRGAPTTILEKVVPRIAGGQRLNNARPL